MTSASEAGAVLLTGMFGTGKSLVAAEMAEVLEERGVPYAAIDLDWLCWGWPGSVEQGAEHRMLLSNLGPVIANYLEVGVTRFILARAVRDAYEVESIRETVGMMLRVVRLEVPWPEIERRLRAEPSASREADLREAREWVGSGSARSSSAPTSAPDGLTPDFTVQNHGRLPREVAVEILGLLGW